MTDRAATIFSGRCTSVRHERDAALGIDVTLVKFRVQRAIKGEPGPTLEIKVLDDRNKVAGIPSFRRGEEVVLFLYGTSDLGFTSPVGLGQGKFSVVTDKRGRKLAFNEFRNENLARDTSTLVRLQLGPASVSSADGVEPSRLLDLTEQLVSRKKTDARR